MLEQAAARFGSGRVVAFGHTGYLGEDVLGVADTARLVSNLSRWASGGKDAPRVGVYKCPGWPDGSGAWDWMRAISPGTRAPARM